MQKKRKFEWKRKHAEEEIVGVEEKACRRRDSRSRRESMQKKGKYEQKRKRAEEEKVGVEEKRKHAEEKNVRVEEKA